MAYQFVPYTHSEMEFEEMRSLLTESYRADRRPRNWRLALLENWNMASRFLEPKSYFTSRVRLWRDEAGALVGFRVRGDHFVHPQARHQDQDLVGEMLAWAESHWAGERGHVRALAYDWDEQRQTLLSGRGYVRGEAVEEVRIYELSRGYAAPGLPTGYCIRSMAEVGDPLVRVELENRIWNAELDEAWFRGKCSAPSYSLDWDLVVVSPEGKLAAAILVWCYPENGAAEIDPLGTAPDFRRKGLARAMVLESFRRMRAAGLHTAYIASDAQNVIVNSLYASLSPSETYRAFVWTKTL
jgi:ribosomal protein S18 acetylase RimI-like enzyme